MKKISGVIMDWAGTAVDYGCFAPLNAFLKVFSEEKGIDITYRQAREPMGLLKIDHIKAILSMPEVNEKFRALYKRDWNKGDVDEMYASFEKHLFASLKDFTTPIPGVLETMAMLREQVLTVDFVSDIFHSNMSSHNRIILFRITGPQCQYFQ